jgi:hypothetical protein
MINVDSDLIFMCAFDLMPRALTDDRSMRTFGRLDIPISSRGTGPYITATGGEYRLIFEIRIAETSISVTSVTSVTSVSKSSSAPR